MATDIDILNTIEYRINVLTKTILDKFNASSSFTEPYLDFEVVKGTKYYKIILITNPKTRTPARSVHAFVARQTGAMYKPASWHAPAKHVRYNLMDDTSFDECLNRCEYAGGYLYIR
jgi:hypothetical protein